MDYQINRILENILYHKNEYISSSAEILLKEYFDEDKVYPYTALQSELSRY
jgi:hypothetical protein